MSSTATLKMLLLGEDRSAGKTLRSVGSDADRTHGHIGRLVKGIGTLAAGLGAFTAGEKLVGFFKDSISEARESQRVNAQTNAVLKSTGHAAGITAAGIGKLATALSNKTGIDDEVIQSSANMLLTFTKVRNEVGKGNDIFNQATRIVTDMSVALGQDGKSSAIQLGKALNDPIRGITALQRVGVSFTEGQRKQIKAMVESGHTMSAQKVILRELNKEFGGSAEAQATPAMKAAVAWGNLKETIGTGLLPVIDKLSTFFVKKVTPALTKFVKEVQTGKGAGGDFRKVLESVGHVLTTVGGFLIRHRGIVKEVVSVWIAWRIAAIAYNLTQIAALIKLKALTVGTVENKVATIAATAATKAMTLAQKALALVMRMSPIGLVVTALALLAAGLIYAYKHSERFRQVVQGAFRAVVNSVLWMVGMVLHGAAAAFGWVPGIGKKLHHAADAFDRFKARVNHALDGVHRNVTVDAHARVNAAIAAVRALRSWIYSVPRAFRTTYYVTQVNRINKLATGQYANTQHNATGTAFWRGGLTWMNEEGPELVDVPRGSRIYPATRSAAMIAAAAGAGGGDTALPVTIQLDGFNLWQGMLQVRRTRNSGRPLGIG